jgi:predicted MFS family arabinose efflux permease
MTARGTVALVATSLGISRIGDALGRVALSFGLLGMPGVKPADLSVVLLCLTIPGFVLVLPAGVLADRVRRNRLLAATDAAAAAAYGLLGTLMFLGAPPLSLAAPALVAGGASAVAGPAFSGLLSAALPTAAIRGATTTVFTFLRAADLGGAAVGGLLVAWLGPPAGLLVNAASFTFSACLLVALRLPRVTTLRAQAGSFTEEFRGGWAHLRTRPWLWGPMLGFAVTTGVLGAGVGVLGPIVARTRWNGPTTWSFVVTASTAGMVSGVLLTRWLRPRRPLVTALTAALLLALPVGLLGAGTPWWTVAAAMFLAGAATDVFDVLWSTALQVRVPEALVSKVSAYDWLGAAVATPLGVAAAGPLASIAGPAPILIGGAILIVVCLSAVLALPDVRSVDVTG